MSYIFFLQVLREASGNVMTPFMLKVTALGESLITYLFLAAVYWCVNKRAGQLMAWNVSIGCWLNQWSKRLFKIDRPWTRDNRIMPVPEALEGAGGYSMPSGHTSRAVATWGAAGYYFVKKDKKNKSDRWLGILFLLISVLILFSRNYLGVHTLEDVLAALGAGIAIMIFTEWLLRWVERGNESGKKNNRDIIAAVIGCIVIFLPMLKYGCLSNAGASFGFIIGWVLERRLLSYEVKGEQTERLLKFIPGAIVLFILLTSGSRILEHFIPEKYAGFFMQGMTAFFIMFAYPLILKAWDKHQYRRRLIGILIVLVFIVLAIAGTRIVKNVRNSVQNTQDVVAETNNSAIDETTTEAVPEPIGEYDNVQIQNVKIIAHRGYSGAAPENTLDAFAKAADIGADMIELDVQMTADGELVVFHDSDLKRITGVDGAVSEWTLADIKTLDAGNGERIPTLDEVIELISPTELGIYLELKDIGESDTFVQKVVETVNRYSMQDRVLYASFNYEYLCMIKEDEENAKILCNTSIGDPEKLLNEYPADCYGVNRENINQDTIRKLKEAGKTVYVWTVNTPVQMRNAITLGADGIVTNEPGMARVVVHEEYHFLTDDYISSFIVPALYDNSLQEPYANNYIMQGLAKAGSVIYISAYDYVAGGNSILYVMNTSGELLDIVDLGFRAHTGGIAYDEAHDLLWVTGAEGTVRAINQTSVRNGSYYGTEEEIVVTFDAGLVNHNGGKVASFLAIDDGKLYVGSYVKGNNGRLLCYDIVNPIEPELLGEVSIPECIQGVTFAYNAEQGRTMILSQGYQTDDAALLCFTWNDEQTEYVEPEVRYTLPEGAEQILMTENGLYILFESAVRPYRATCRVPNDRVWLVDYKR